MLRNINLKDRYKSTLKNEIRNDFLNPVISNSVRYKRAVGYFSSSMLLYIIDGLEDFFENGGTIDLITSPELNEEDKIAIIQGYRQKEEVIEDSLLRNFAYDDSQSLRYKYLEMLIRTGKMNIKIAVMKNISNYGIFHDKIGILTDAFGDEVAFSGSLNESENALCNNYESIQVFASWRTKYEVNQINSISSDFQKLWENNDELVDTYSIPSALRNRILSCAHEIEIVKIEDRVETNIFDDKIPRVPEFLSLRRDYQNKAINSWKSNNYVGLLNMATGTGKTYTALMGMTDLYGQIEGNIAVIILCPYIHLVDQWYEDVLKFNFRAFKAYGLAKLKWKDRISENIRWLNKGTSKHFCCIVTTSTFVTEEFQNYLNLIKKDIILVADEAHNLGSSSFKPYLDDRFKYRLGLSATPVRHNDSEGTNQILHFFDKEVYYFGLEDAIGKYLTEYYYYPQIIYLDDEEYEEYYELSVKIQKQMQINNDLEESTYLKSLLIERSRLIAKAKGKINKLKELFLSNADFTDSLVYCGATYVENDKGVKDKKQIDAITNLLGNEFDLKVAKFTANEDAESRMKIISDFENKKIDSIVAIKCLDEGVNIPSIRNAYILASSTNPREFIQRRGRVLRKYNGKDYANIYDFVVFPRKKNEIPKNNKKLLKIEFSLIKREIERVYEFCKLSNNPFTSISEIEDIYNEYIIILGGQYDERS